MHRAAHDPFNWCEREITYFLKRPLSEFCHPTSWKVRETAWFFVLSPPFETFNKKLFFQNKLFLMWVQAVSTFEREHFTFKLAGIATHKQMPDSKPVWFPFLAQGFKGKIKRVALY